MRNICRSAVALAQRLPAFFLRVVSFDQSTVVCSSGHAHCKSLGKNSWPGCKKYVLRFPIPASGKSRTKSVCSFIVTTWRHPFFAQLKETWWGSQWAAVAAACEVSWKKALATPKGACALSKEIVVALAAAAAAAVSRSGRGESGERVRERCKKGATDFFPSHRKGE